jgi:hypothetical protein
MKTTLGTGALVAALFAGAAAATPITVGKSQLVIDVEFLGRERIRMPDPNGSGEDILTYGERFRGAFSINVDDAPRPRRTSDFPTNPNAALYRGSPGAEFVDSGRFSPISGLGSDDHVTIGDNLPFYPDLPRRDWFEVSDRLTDFAPSNTDYRELFISVTTPLDIIHGTGLEQEFELVTPSDNGGSGGGFFRTRIGDAIVFVNFIVDRLRVKTHLVCRP